MVSMPVDKTDLLALRAQAAAAEKVAKEALRRVNVALAGERPSQPSAEETGGHRALTVDLDADKLEADRRAFEDQKRALEKDEKAFTKARIDSLRWEQTDARRRRNEILWKIGLVLIALFAAFLFRRLGIQ